LRPLELAQARTSAKTSPAIISGSPSMRSRRLPRIHASALSNEIGGHRLRSGYFGIIRRWQGLDVMPSPAQLRAARVMLVCRRSCLSVPTVKRAEADVGVRVSDAVRAAITVVLKDAGVEFIDGDEPGVKLKRPARYEAPIRSAQRRKRRVIPARMYANSPLVLPGSSRVSPHHGVSGGWIRPTCHAYVP